MKRIFISYRRADSASMSKRLYDALARHLGEESIFRDVDSLLKGHDFRAGIERFILESDTMLVLIGNQWLTIADGTTGQRRLDNPNDFVRIEVELGLRHVQTVIPVLIDGASMPDLDALPRSLADLAFRNAAQIRDDSFDDDFARLLTDLKISNKHQPKRSFTIIFGIIFLFVLTLAIGFFGVREGGFLRSTNNTDGMPLTQSIDVMRTVTKIVASTRISSVLSITDTPDLIATASQLPTETLLPRSQPTRTPIPITMAGELDAENVRCLSDIPMVFIAETSFTMGSEQTDESPIRDVIVGAFCMDEFEVTNEQYFRCVYDNSCENLSTPHSRLYRDYYGSESYTNFPVINVTWHQALAFCEYRGGRLPTEAEWELVSRYDPLNQTTRIYPWGDTPPNPSFANYSGVGVGDVVEIGQYLMGRSGLGVQDLSGNVAEWVMDWYAPYDRSETLNPQGADAGQFRVVRGGSYASNSDEIRGANRDKYNPNLSSNQIGFRCVID